MKLPLPVQVQIISVLKACRNHGGNNISRLTRMGKGMGPAAATTSLTGSPHERELLIKPPIPFQIGSSELLIKPPIPFQICSSSPSLALGNNGTSSSSTSNNNPCLELFFKYPLDADIFTMPSPPELEYHEHLKQLLPLAWSHDPLTTLKIICNLLDRRTTTGKSDKKAFYVAAFWLHHNHPKTLACNLLSIAGSFGHITCLVDILYCIVQGRVPVAVREKRMTYFRQGERERGKEKASLLLKRRKMIAAAKKAAERYHSDPNYQLLQDRVADIFAECLKYDIEKMQQKEPQPQQHHDHDHDDYCSESEITDVASWCPSIDSSMARPTDVLYESIARKVFPRESYAQAGVWVSDKLNKEVLVPLRKALKPSKFKQYPFAVDEYMEEVKAGGQSKIKADAVLPHHILYYIMKGGDLGQVAELQWKRMVEGIYLKQGKLNNCLAVCDGGCGFGTPSSPYRVPMAMGLLLSQLSDEPWKGKVIFYSRNPLLHLIQGNDIQSKCEFMKAIKGSVDRQDFPMDLRKVFDLILQVAVNGNLKPEQMIKRVFLFNTIFSPDFHLRWETDYYEQVQSKFEEKGYGDVVPHLVCWNLCKPTDAPHRTKPGLTVLSSVSDNLLKSFLDNDGELGPDHVMEAAIAGQGYQSLVVVD